MRASVGGAITVGDQKDGNTTYNVAVTNRGIKDVGLDVEGVTAFGRVPAGTNVISGAGAGYKGVQPLAKLGLQPGLQMATHPNEQGVTERPAPDSAGDVVIVWKIPKLVAGDKLTLSFTLAGGTPAPEILKAMGDGSTVYWDTPGRNAFGSALAYRDTRTPDKGDHERMAPPRMPAPARP